MRRLLHLYVSSFLALARCYESAAQERTVGWGTRDQLPVMGDTDVDAGSAPIAASPGPTATSVDKLFDPGYSLEERFGMKIEGVVGQQMLFKAYGMKFNASLQLFSRNGVPLLRRHWLNSRRQLAVRRKYKARLIRHGVVQGVRGRLGLSWARQLRKTVVTVRRSFTWT